MLDYMRRNANSWIMILLFGIIIFVFAINFGPWAGNLAPSVPYAALVNSKPISMAEFRTAYASQFARLKQFRGPDYDQSQAEKDGLKQMVIEQLISRELLSQLGTEHQLTIGAKTLAEAIKERVFDEDTPFSKEEYVRRVNAFFQSTIAQFEEQVKKELLAEQMADLLGTAVTVSEAETKAAFLDKNTKVALEFVKVNPNYFTAPMISEVEVKNFLENNRQKISEYYNENIGEYIKEPEIRASHILVKVAPNTTAEEKGKLKEKAQKLYERIKNNEDFAEIAKKESDDIGSKDKGGDLGFFSAGMMVEEFSKPAFALKPGEVSTVVESPFGFHIIKQIESKPKLERKLEDVSSEIAKLLLEKDTQNQKAKELASQALHQLKTKTPLAEINVAGLVNVKATGKTPSEPFLPVADETASFSLSSGYIQKIGRAEPINEAAFKLTLNNPTPDHVIEANGEFFAIRLKSREEPDMAKYEEQKESIKSSLLFPRKRAFMQQYLSHLKANAKITYNDALMASPEVNL